MNSENKNEEKCDPRGYFERSELGSIPRIATFGSVTGSATCALFTQAF